MNPVYCFDIPWLNLSRLVIFKLKNLKYRVRLEPADIDVGEIRNGEFYFYSRDEKLLNVMTKAERLCFEVMPKSAPLKKSPEEFAKILQDPFWQSVIDAAAMIDVMER